MQCSAACNFSLTIHSTLKFHVSSMVAVQDHLLAMDEHFWQRHISLTT